MMVKKMMNGAHAAVMVLAVVLIAVSSHMAYPLSDLSLIIIFGGIIIVLDLLMIIALKEDGIVRDAAMLVTVVLTTLCLCRTLSGRADLMGYVWFSDLEKGNPAAVSSMNLAAGSMACFLLCAVVNIVSGFRKSS